MHVYVALYLFAIVSTICKVTIIAYGRSMFSTLSDLEEVRRQKEQLEKSLEGIKADYQAEMEKLELENQELKARALKEKEEREKYQELVKMRERVGLMN